jgi:hypothetical protein
VASYKVDLVSETTTNTLITYENVLLVIWRHQMILTSLVCLRVVSDMSSDCIAYFIPMHGDSCPEDCVGSTRTKASADNDWPEDCKPLERHWTVRRICCHYHSSSNLDCV